MSAKKISLFLVLLIVQKLVYAQSDFVKSQFEKLQSDSKGTIGVAVLNLETNAAFNFNGHAKLVLHSVAKFPIAIKVLHMVDQNELTLDQKIHIEKEDLPKTYSPLRDKYPDGNIDVSIADLLSYMVSLSDNDACDILLKKIGGASVVEAYMKSIGLRQIAIKASEADMAAKWNVQYENWCEPLEMTRLIKICYNGNILSKTSNDYLWKIMTETSTGMHRIKGLLPAGTIVAHKTGTSPTNGAGLSPATNDVGIITLPNGNHLAVAVFLCNSTADAATRDNVIAKVSKTVWDYFVK